METKELAQNNVQAKRIDFIDVAKGIGMFCIILGHSNNDFLYSVVFTFHIPLFFLLSGYFVSADKPAMEFVKNKARYIMVPYLFFGLLVLMANVIEAVFAYRQDVFRVIFDSLISIVYGIGTEIDNALCAVKPIGAIWFLPALFWALIIVRVLINKKYGIGFIILIALISYITSKFVWLPFDIQAGGTAAVFVYIGALLKKADWKFKPNVVLFVAGIVCLLVEVYFGIYVRIVCNYYGMFGLSILGALLISYSVVFVSYYMSKVTIIREPLCFVGRNSIIMLGFHLLEMTIFDYNAFISYLTGHGINKMVSLLFVLVFKVIFIASCTWLIVNVKWLRKIFKKETLKK